MIKLQYTSISLPFITEIYSNNNNILVYMIQLTTRYDKVIKD